MTIKKILPNNSKYVVSIQSDANTSINSGFLYIHTVDAFYVINMGDSSIYDMYTKTFAGRVGETLNRDNIDDGTVS